MGCGCGKGSGAQQARGSSFPPAQRQQRERTVVDVSAPRPGYWQGYPQPAGADAEAPSE